jgi:broad specificity phosphatase PhoE
LTSHPAQAWCQREAGLPRLVLVRHAQASLGSSNYDRLSPRGRTQARQLARRLDPLLDDQPLIFTGTLRRHRQTLSALGAGDAEFSPDLDEFSTDGLVRAALARAESGELPLPPRHQLLDPVRYLPELLDWFPAVLAAWQNGELDESRIGAWSDFRQRVLRPLALWRTALDSGRSVIVVSSAGVIATLASELAGHDRAWQRSLAVALYNASVTELRSDGDGWHLACCNCIAHLEDRAQHTLA